MRDNKQERAKRFYESMQRYGISHEDANKLRLIEKTLHRWCELECGDGNDYASWSVEREETTGKPFMVRHPHSSPTIRTPIADKEKGALKRLDAIMALHPELVYYYQTDPRGCALYVVRKLDLNDGADIDSVYTRGIAVCVD